MSTGISHVSFRVLCPCRVAILDMVSVRTVLSTRQQYITNLLLLSSVAAFQNERPLVTGPGQCTLLFSNSRVPPAECEAYDTALAGDNKLLMRTALGERRRPALLTAPDGWARGRGGASFVTPGELEAVCLGPGAAAPTQPDATRGGSSRFSKGRKRVPAWDR
jgi:hypothetical protein